MLSRTCQRTAATQSALSSHRSWHTLQVKFCRQASLFYLGVSASRTRAGRGTVCRVRAWLCDAWPVGLRPGLSTPGYDFGDGPTRIVVRFRKKRPMYPLRGGNIPRSGGTTPCCTEIFYSNSLKLPHARGTPRTTFTPMYITRTKNRLSRTTKLLVGRPGRVAAHVLPPRSPAARV